MRLQRFRLAFFACMVLFYQMACSDDFVGPELPSLATPAQRLMIEQVEELIESGEEKEALSGLLKLLDQPPNRLIEVGAEQRSGTIRTRRYVSLREWSKYRLAAFLVSHPQANEKYQNRVRESARVAYARLQKSKDAEQLSRASERYFASEYGPSLALLQADLALEQGWGVAAVQAAQAACSDLRIEIDGGDLSQGTVSWPHVWRSIETPSAEAKERFEELLQRPLASGRQRGILLAEAIQRVVRASAIAPDQVDRSLVVRWARFAADFLSEDEADLLKELLDSQEWFNRERSPQTSRTFGGSGQRNYQGTAISDVKDWPSWSESIPRITATTDRIPASLPRVGELERGTLAFHPVWDQDRIFINNLTQVVCFDRNTGKPWPNPTSERPLFDSRIARSALLPISYPLVGTPRGTLTVTGSELYARMGNPVTGWATERPSADAGSLSFLIGLDLSREGSALPGFPIRLLPPEFEQAEFEGAPLAVGNLLIAAITQRDDVGLTRSVVAFDRYGGELLWRSSPLASGTLPGIERANLVSHQLLSCSGGCVYYSTNLGVVACLDVLTGRIHWVCEYSRVDRQRQRYPSADRFLYRDLTPCVVWRGLVYCAPRDCAEIFALDATTGDLIWASDAGHTHDLIHLIGIVGESLVVGGDRIAWFDRLSGKLQAFYPGSTTPGLVNSLPASRGLGRGTVAGTEILWPIENQVLVFPGDLKNGKDRYPVVEPTRRLKIDAIASEGGNIFTLDDKLLFLTPSRILLFDGKEKSD